MTCQERLNRELKASRIILAMESQMLGEFGRSLDDPATYEALARGVKHMALSDETRKVLLDRLDQIAQSRRAAVVVRAVG
jgi:hypothetical protein